MKFEVTFDSGGVEILIEVEADDEADAIQCVREAMIELPYRCDNGLQIRPMWQH